MRIGIDARMINASGIGRYIKNLILQLEKIDADNDYYIFLLPEDFHQLNFNKNFHKVLTNFRWYTLEEQRFFPPLLAKLQLDLLHVPHFNIPIFYWGKIIVTIHDLTHLDFKMSRASTHNNLVYEMKHLLYRQVMGQALKKSRKILTPSNFVKAEIVSRWQLAENKIVVTPEAVDDKFLSLSQQLSAQDSKRLLDKFNIKPPYIFYIGNAHPHKNVAGLIQAFRKLRLNYQYLPLVLAGPESYFWNQIKKTIESDQNIIYLGFVSDEEQVALYKNAQALVFPSFSEG